MSGRIALLVVLALAGPVVSSADLIVQVEDLNLADDATSAELLVSITATGPSSYQVSGYDLDIVLVPQASASGVAFAGINKSAADYIFAGNDSGLFTVYLNAASNVSAGDVGSSATATSLSSVTRSLVKIPLAITAPLNAGDTFDVQFNTLMNASAVYSGAQFTVLPVTWTDGQITVHATPEPATLALLAIGAAAVFGRRRLRRAG